MDGIIPSGAGDLAITGGVWAAAIGMVDQAGRCRWTAMVRAAMASSARVWSRIAQPEILRVKRSRTAAG